MPFGLYNAPLSFKYLHHLNNNKLFVFIKTDANKGILLKASNIMFGSELEFVLASICVEYNGFGGIPFGLCSATYLLHLNDYNK